jgi:hypothetical protein
MEFINLTGTIYIGAVEPFLTGRQPPLEKNLSAAV